nr:MAG TPA: hypothetical protein [Caudoviricetes sp.]
MQPRSFITRILNPDKTDFWIAISNQRSVT